MNDKKNEALISFEKLKLEIQLQAKNGIDFIFAAAIIWFGIFFNLEVYTRCLLRQKCTDIYMGHHSYPVGIGVF